MKPLMDKLEPGLVGNESQFSPRSLESEDSGRVVVRREDPRPESTAETKLAFMKSFSVSGSGVETAR